MSTSGIESLRTGGGGGTSRMFALGVLSAAAVTAGIFILRQQRQVPAGVDQASVSGEAAPGHISVDRLRELGI